MPFLSFSLFLPVSEKYNKEIYFCLLGKELNVKFMRKEETVATGHDRQPNIAMQELKNEECN